MWHTLKKEEIEVRLKTNLKNGLAKRTSRRKKARIWKE